MKIIKSAKKYRTAIFALILAAALGTALLIHLREKETSPDNLLKSLEMSQVEYVGIYTGYGKKETRLSEEDAAEVVRQMRQVKLGEETEDFYQWQGCRFPCLHVKQKDNIEFDFSPSGPFYIISTENFGFQLERNSTSMGYWVEGDEQSTICHELSLTYAALAEKYFPEI